LDIVVVNRRAAMEIWRNTTVETGNWAGIEPMMPAPNRNAVGAWVELRSEAGVQAQEVTVGGGHAGGQALPLHFGLGRADRAEVRVIWPDGTAGPWQVVPLNRVTAIPRGG
ncbi:MAG: ASPIC/UnbV domain-containing protein, partial [Rhodobacteraceae bacterium]|nr:ASPIC/UnbV domain-containing protein [Paracoccaceae bacterium]